MFENRALEILIIAAVVLLLFGAKRLPETARGLGKSLRIFKSEVSAMKTDTAQSTTAQSTTARSTTPPRARIQAVPAEAGRSQADIETETADRV
ncbi:Sec-independent protein translocase subunit TatA [Streptomyces sp. NPDC058964]|uniref:Sec-independent protein translocase subunit TatA n=1 Tax=Streptomyces sp. NPDC058964 TaxID=3346681 RepID=UPI0036BFF0B9